MADPAWHDDDEFWRLAEPVLFSPERLAGTVSEVEGVLALLGVARGARLLDQCTGTGRHALELARRGFAVTGVDRTARYLERARAAARDRGVELELVEADAREFVRPGAFDGAMNLFTSFGFFDDAGNLAVAKSLAASLRPGARAVIDVNGKETLARVFQPRGWAESEGVLLLEDRKIVPGYSHVETRWILVRDGQRRDFTLRLRLYSGLELRDVLLAAGFSQVDLYGSFTGAPYDQDAKRLIAVAQK